MSFNIGANIGPYRIIEQLGQGGMATVFKAYHAALDRYVALKVLHPAFNEDQTFAARFQREARVVAKLEHINIVPVYDYSEFDNRPYLVMKFIEGDTLKARINKGPLSSDELEKVVNSVGSALEYAHRSGILHRDIKPSNVLLSTDGLIYLADFGLARIAQAGESTLSSDSIMGTPQYISPEQAMGKKDLDAGTDIYSFGVMLYELVVGQVPFSADTPFSIIHDHIYTPLPLPMDINPEVPEPVQRVLLKALAKERKDRYESIEEMVHAFKEAWVEAGIPMTGTSITMRPSSLKSQTDEMLPAQRTAVAKGKQEQAPAAAEKRSPFIWVGLGFAAVLCLGLLALFAFRGNGAIRRFLADRAATQQPVPTLPSNPTPDTPEPTDSAPQNPTPEGLSPAVASAMELVNQNPGDPYAHLALSLALWDGGDKRASAEELAQAANLAGPTNEAFFLTAVRDFKTREAWVPTAGMYLRVVPIYNNSKMPDEIRIGLHEAVYKAAEQKEMPLFVFFERIDAAELPLGYIARSRYALFNGDIKEAQSQFSNAERVGPDMYEVFLLKAEIAMKLKDNAKAGPILVSLSSDLGAPEWIRVMAASLLKTIE